MEPSINGLEFFDHYKEKMPDRMKMKSIFYELPYWENHKIVHLLDPTHILKNVSYYLWRHISLKKSDTLDFRRDFISSNTRKKHWLKKENRGEVSHS